jgi:tricorn protease
MKKISLLILACVLSIGSLAQIHAQIPAKLLRYIDLSDTHLSFVYGGDVWTVAKKGGTATRLTDTPGEESWPKFSADGKHIGYSANYNGNQDVYVIAVQGGIPHRVTHHSFSDRMIDWHPNGKQLLIGSAGTEGGRRLLNQFSLVNKEGGFPEKLPIPYGELASFSPDGSKLAYITAITEDYPLKRIRSGRNSDILIYDMKTQKVENVTNRIAIDGKPAWSANKLFFLSDDNPQMRLNIWSYDPTTKNLKQETNFKDFDLGYLAANGDELVFEMGGELYLMDTKTAKYEKITINVVSDLSLEIPKQVDVSGSIANASISPDAKRVLFEARGEIFNVPAKEGFSLNLTHSSGAFDQSPAWSPDGKSVAYWSDRSGEYEIWIQDAMQTEGAKQLTKRKLGFGYTLFWSPDSKHIAFIDEKNDISVIDAKSGKTQLAGNTVWNISHPGRPSYSINWSHDSNWIAFTKGLDNAHFAVMVYSLETKKTHQLTSGFYNDSNPIFSADGQYMFFMTDRNMESVYSAMGDATWVYPNATHLVAVGLTADTPSILPPKNDMVEVKEEEADTDKKSDDEKSEEKEEKKESLKIDVEDFESRMEVIPISPGNIGDLSTTDGKVIYMRYPRSGSGERSSSLVFYDIKEREEKTIAEGIGNYLLAADGKSILASSRGSFAIISVAPGQKMDEQVSTDGLAMQWVARAEWNQLFNDTWRRYRDFFYDANTQGVDWKEMKNRYEVLLPYARTKWDVANIQSSMLAELSAGHTYTRTGLVEATESVQTGFLGIEWEKKGNIYTVGKIVKPAAWDTEVRSPFDRPGVKVKEGDAIISVNGMKLDPNKDPYAAFEGLSGETVSLHILAAGAKMGDEKEVIVDLLSPGEEATLRYLAWIERNRLMVDKLSNGQLGYVYMSNTAADGQRELVAMYYGQLDKKGFVIDERFNGGGQLADRFLELLQRPVVYNLHWRHGRDHTQPTATNTGPVGMLINGWAGSGGDGLPWAFKELKAGPIVGKNTLGILVGPATGHTLIDGSGITVPGARLYDNAGHWFWEGEGVSPDIEVWNDPNSMMEGRDPQMERLVEELLKMMKTQTSEMTPAPAYDDRTAKGLQKKN